MGRIWSRPARASVAAVTVDADVNAIAIFIVPEAGIANRV